MSSLLHGADYNYEQWLDRPDILDEDFELMKKSGCNVMAVGIFSWASYETREGSFDFVWMDTLLDRMHANGIKAILATPSGSKPAWMSKRYPEVCRVDVNGHREHHAGRHNHCRTSPVYRAKCADINARLAERYKNHPALYMWHVSNEYNAGRCYCPLCLEAFRAWLKQRYGTLDELNKAWWTSFWSHRFGDWDEIYPADSSVNGMMLDWARFTSDQTIDFFEHESAPLRKLTPGVPITTNFMFPDVGIDYYKLSKRLGQVSWDNYPTWHFTGDDVAIAIRTAFVHDLYRSAKHKSFLMMESTPSHTNWQGVSPRKRPNVHAIASLQAVAHGSDSVQYFQWRQSRGGEEKFHGAVMSHLGTADTRVFQDVAQVGEILGRLDLAGSATQKAEVAIVYDFENSWAIDLAQLPRSVEKKYQETVISHYAAFWKRNIPVDIISAAEEKLENYKLVVAPMLYVTGEETAERFERFVRNGGHLVGTYLTSVVGSSDLVHLGGAPGPLAAVFGLRVEETDAVPTARPQSIRVRNGSKAGDFAASHYADLLRLEGAEAVAHYEQDFLSGLPALTKHKLDKGNAWYVATRLGDDFNDWFYAMLAEQLSIGSAAAGFGPAPQGLSIRRRGEGNGEVVFLMNFNDRPLAFDLGKTSYRNLADDTTVSGKIEIAAYGLALLTRVT